MIRGIFFRNPMSQTNNDMNVTAKEIWLQKNTHNWWRSRSINISRWWIQKTWMIRGKKVRNPMSQTNNDMNVTAKEIWLQKNYYQ
jgi:hypothetical protein